MRRGNRSLPHRTEPRAEHTVHPTPIAARQTAPAAAFTKVLMRAKFALRAPRPEPAAETCAAMHPPAKKPQQARRQRKLRHGSRADDDPAYEQKQPVEGTKKVQSGADRLLKAISAQPAVTQGIIWNEILSAPAAARDSD